MQRVGPGCGCTRCPLAMAAEDMTEKSRRPTLGLVGGARRCRRLVALLACLVPTWCVCQLDSPGPVITVHRSAVRHEESALPNVVTFRRGRGVTKHKNRKQHTALQSFRFCHVSLEQGVGRRRRP